jgi:phenolic acid decarboxylase
VKNFFNIRNAFLFIIVFASASILYSQNNLLSNNRLLQYIPDNFTGYSRVENSTFVIPRQYSKIAVSWYAPTNDKDSTTQNNIANTQIRLVILNFNDLAYDNATGLGNNQVIDQSGNPCDTIIDNVSVDNFTGTLFNNNCQEGFLFSLYIPLFASEDYLLAVNVDGPNVNDINNLINNIDLGALSNEINNL